MMLNYPLLLVEESREARDSLREILHACGFECSLFADKDTALNHLAATAPEGSTSIVVFGEKTPSPNPSLFLEGLQKQRIDLWKKASVFVLNTIPVQVQSSDGPVHVSSACRLTSLANLLSMLRSLRNANALPAQRATLAAQS